MNTFGDLPNEALEALARQADENPGGAATAAVVLRQRSGDRLLEAAASDEAAMDALEPHARIELTLRPL